MTVSKVKEIVARLLDRTTANGCTPGEASVAIAKAHELLAKHGLSLGDISREESLIEKVKINTDTKTLSAIQVSIACALKEHFGVEVIKSRSSDGSSRLCVIGERVKVEIFNNAFVFAYTAFKSNWNKFNRTLTCSTQEKNAHRGTYLQGFINGLTNELIRQENDKALVVSKSQSLKDFMNNMGKMKSCSYSNRASHSSEVYNNGYQAGAFAQRSKGKVLDSSVA